MENAKRPSLSVAALGLVVVACTGSLAGTVRAPNPPARQGRVGVHGMIVVGDARVFLSHIPMFSPPHDAQVLFEAELSDFVGRPPSFSGELFTFEPRPFSLDALMAGALTSFQGDLYRGSFENGGAKLASGLRVRVRRMLVARYLGTGRASDDVLFGVPGATFVLRGIDTAADMDQIARVHVTSAIDAGTLASGVTLARTTFRRLHAGDTLGPVVVEQEISCLVGPDYDRACE